MDVILKKYFWVLNLVVIGVCAGFAGRAASHVLEGAYLAAEDPKPPTRRSSSSAPVKTRTKDTEDLVKRNVFCSGCMPAVPVDNKAAPTSNEPQKTSLQLELISTMVVPSDPIWSVAVIRDLAGKEKETGAFYKDKKIFATDAIVEAVQRKRVYLRNQGRLEYLELDGATPPAAAAASPPPVVAAATPMDPAMGDVDKGVNCSGNNCTVDKQLVEKMLSNTAMLATAARFVPSIKDGKANGFKLYAIRPNSIFGKIGLQNGDTVKAINGMDMSTPDKALELYTKLRNASHLSVSVERRGETVTMDYAIR